MEKTKKKTEVKGITLIALVITVIVLLILAAISIIMLTGDNSILKRSVDAKERTERAQIIEGAKTDILGQIAENKGTDITEQQFIDVLKKFFNNEDVPSLLPDDLTTLEMRTKNNNYKILASEIYNGKITKLVPGLYDANENMIKSFDELVTMGAIRVQNSTEIHGNCNLNQFENGVELIIDDNITKITNGAFAGCNKLKKVIIGNNVEIITAGAFQNCTSLKDVIIGKKVKEISYAAFNNCYSITDLEIPDNVQFIKRK